MSENENVNESLKVGKSKLLYALHIVVPMGLVALSTVGMILSYLQTSASSTLNITSNNTTYNITAELSDQDKLIDMLDLNNKKDQDLLMSVINTINFVFSLFAVLYSKMMNSEQHSLGKTIIKAITEKNAVLEQMTNITNSISRPITVRNEDEHIQIVEGIADLSVLHTPNDRINTGRSSSSVYIAPYNHTSTAPYN